jgi:hypothetical protein
MLLLLLLLLLGEREEIYGKCGRKVSSKVKRYRKYGRKIS